MNEKNKKIDKKAGIVIGAIVIALMLTIGVSAVRLQNATITNDKLEDKHCPVCDYLQRASFDGDDNIWGFDGTLEDYLARYGEEGAREILCPIFNAAGEVGCTGGALNAIISEFEATGSLDGYFASLYSYVTPQSSIGTESSSRNRQYAGFDIQPKVGDGVPMVERHYYSEDDLGLTYEEIYARALDTRDWCEGGPFPDWAGNDPNDPTGINSVIDCVQWLMRAAGVGLCFISMYAINIFFGLDVFIAAIQAFLNFGPEIIDYSIQAFQLCVEIVSQIRAGFGLPP